MIVFVTEIFETRSDEQSVVSRGQQIKNEGLSLGSAAAIARVEACIVKTPADVFTSEVARLRRIGGREGGGLQVNDSVKGALCIVKLYNSSLARWQYVYLTHVAVGEGDHPICVDGEGEGGVIRVITIGVGASPGSAHTR